MSAAVQSARALIFTGEAVRLLQSNGVRDAHRVRLGSAYDWYSALLLSFGVVRLYGVIGDKDAIGPAST